MKLSMAIAAAIGMAASSAVFAQASGDPAKGQLIVQQVCIACHGADGNSTAPANPNLASQHPEYLYKQLVEFKKGVRKNPVMAGMAATLSDDDMHNVAAYMSQQKVKVHEGTEPDMQALGGKIYKAGNPATGVPACAGCHGPKGSGLPVQFPRLAGQHPEYTLAQLNAFRSGERANDPNGTMRGVAAKMSDAEMKAVANYITGLR